MVKISYILFFLALMSCNNFKSTKGFDEKNLIKPIDLGSYHKLLDEAISVYLPEGFKKLSEAEINAFHQQIKDEKTRYYLKKAYEAQRFYRGNFYNFYSEAAASEITIRTLPFMPFGKRDAGQLLYILRKGFEEYQEVSGIYHHKIKATYSRGRSLQFFKANYRLSRFNSHKDNNDKENYEIFKIVYLISAHKKTFMISILTPFDVDFDPYIRKIKL